jgi:hypothetical protein
VQDELKGVIHDEGEEFEVDPPAQKEKSKG